MIFFSPCNPPAPPPIATNPPPSHPMQRAKKSPFRVHFGPFRVRFGSVSVRFGRLPASLEVLGGVGVGSGRGGSVREKNITRRVLQREIDSKFRKLEKAVTCGCFWHLLSGSRGKPGENDFPPILSEHLGLKPPFVRPRLRFPNFSPSTVLGIG